MGAKRKTVLMSSTDQVKIVQPTALSVAPTESAQDMADYSTESKEVDESAAGTEQMAEGNVVKKKAARTRSARYVAVRAQIDKTKKYDPFAAIELLKKLSYTKFPGTITVHAVVKEVGMTASLQLPHSSGKKLRVAVIDDALLKTIEGGTIEFDVLIATPQFMPKLAKLAPILGPKGLMPNPKNGTLTAKPEIIKAKLEGGTVTIKTEKKAPLMHIQIGKTSMATKDLVENIEAVTKSLNTKLDRLAIAATMSPGIKVEVVAAKVE